MARRGREGARAPLTPLPSSLPPGTPRARSGTTAWPPCTTGERGAGGGEAVERRVQPRRPPTPTPPSPSGAAAAVVVYDITSPDSFARAQAWVRELQRQAAPGLAIALAGNKADLEAERAVSTDDARAYADANGLRFFEASAKTGDGVADIFADLASRVPKASPGGGAGGAAAAAPAGITLAAPPPREARSSCC